MNKKVGQMTFGMRNMHRFSCLDLCSHTRSRSIAANEDRVLHR